jgi:uncharacterized alpha-E superfamily protein
MLDVNLQSMLDCVPERAGERWNRLFRCLRIEIESTPSAYEATDALTFGEKHDSVAHCIYAARENARQVRQQISSEMWEQLNGLYLNLRDTTMMNIWSAEPYAFFSGIKQGTHLFQGITDSTLSHQEGWHFIQIGRYLERASSKAQLLNATFPDRFDTEEPNAEIGEYLDWVGLLRSCTAFEAYCKAFTADLRPERIAEFLVLNAEFPQSVAFCAAEIRKSLTAISGGADVPLNAKVNRLAGRLCAALEYANIDEILSGAGLHSFLADLQRQCGEVHEAIYQKFITYPIDAALAS